MNELLNEITCNTNKSKKDTLVEVYGLIIASLFLQNCNTNHVNTDTSPQTLSYKIMRAEENEVSCPIKEAEKYLDNALVSLEITKALKIREKKGGNETCLIIANSDPNQRVEMRISGNIFYFSIKGEGNFICEVMDNGIAIRPEKNINDNVIVKIADAIRDFLKTIEEINRPDRTIPLDIIPSRRGEDEFWLHSPHTRMGETHDGEKVPINIETLNIPLDIAA